MAEAVTKKPSCVHASPSAAGPDRRSPLTRISGQDIHLALCLGALGLQICGVSSGLFLYLGIFLLCFVIPEILSVAGRMTPGGRP